MYVGFALLHTVRDYARNGLGIKGDVAMALAEVTVKQ